MQHRFIWKVCLFCSNEGAIRWALERAFPEMRWEEGDSFWDKIRVWGSGPGMEMRVYRYESPGPFDLTITLDLPEGGDPEPAALATRDKVLLVLQGVLWKPLRAQPVDLIHVDGRFPKAYEFECDLEPWAIRAVIDAAEFGVWGVQERLRLEGGAPHYTIEVSEAEPGSRPALEKVHEAVQQTILPGIGARKVRPARRDPRAV